MSKSMMKTALSALAVTLFLAAPAAALAEEAAAPKIPLPPPVEHYDSARQATKGTIEQSRQTWQAAEALRQEALEKQREIDLRNRELHTDTSFAATQNDQLSWQNVMLQRQQDYLNQMQNDNQLASAMLQNQQQAAQIRLQYQQQARQNALANQQAMLQNAIQQRQNNIGNWQQRRTNDVTLQRQAVLNAMQQRRTGMQNAFQHRQAMQQHRLNASPYLGPAGRIYRPGEPR